MDLCDHPSQLCVYVQDCNCGIVYLIKSICVRIAIITVHKHKHPQWNSKSPSVLLLILYTHTTLPQIMQTLAKQAKLYPFHKNLPISCFTLQSVNLQCFLLSLSLQLHYNVLSYIVCFADEGLGDCLLNSS